MEPTDYLSLHLVTSAFALGLTWIILYLRRKVQNLPPGPWGLPYFGYYPFLSRESHIDFARLSKRYGNIFSFRSAGGKLFVILNGQKLVKNVLVNRSNEFIGKPNESTLLGWLSNGLGVAQEEGSSWKEHRRYFLQTAKNFGFGKLEIEGTIHEEIENLIEDLKKTNSQPTDVNFHVTYVISSVISQIMFATKFEKYGPIFPKLAKSAHDLVSAFADKRLMLVGFPFRFSIQWLPWGADVREGRIFLKKVVKNIIDDHIRTFDPNHLRDYVDTYLCEMENLKKNGKLEKSSFTMERLLAISMNMTMEGSEGESILNLLTEASKYPEEQRKVQEELDSVVGKERLPSLLDRPKLPYFEAFLQELFRTAQAFLNTTHYCNFEETTIEGYRIPKRSIIIGNLWSMNNDPNIFPNPSKFDPSRFLAKDGQKLKNEGPYPFSMGKRECVGKSLAKIEVFLLVSSILQRFTLLPGGKHGYIRTIPRN